MGSFQLPRKGEQTAIVQGSHDLVSADPVDGVGNVLFIVQKVYDVTLVILKPCVGNGQDVDLLAGCQHKRDLGSVAGEGEGLDRAGNIQILLGQLTDVFLNLFCTRPAIVGNVKNENGIIGLIRPAFGIIIGRPVVAVVICLFRFGSRRVFFFFRSCRVFLRRSGRRFFFGSCRVFLLGFRGRSLRSLGGGIRRSAAAGQKNRNTHESCQKNSNQFFHVVSSLRNFF